jgi:hypothetical protein
VKGECPECIQDISFSGLCCSVHRTLSLLKEPSIDVSILLCSLRANVADKMQTDESIQDFFSRLNCFLYDKL